MVFSFAQSERCLNVVPLAPERGRISMKTQALRLGDAVTTSPTYPYEMYGTYNIYDMSGDLHQALTLIKRSS